MQNAYFTGFLGNQMEQLGKYGFLRRDYLKNHRNSLYQVMLLQDTIGEHLLEVDKAAREREEIILKQLEKKKPLPDKEKDQMAWVRAANQHRAIAEEIILKELIYIQNRIDIFALIAYNKNVKKVKKTKQSMKG